MATPVMTFHITIDRSEVSSLESPAGQVRIIPFGGSVESELFTGTMRPGAADVQITDAAGCRHMCARYMFTGTDNTGKACSLFVDNNGWFERDHRPKPFEACPSFLTDSESLAPYLHSRRFRAEGHSSPEGVDILIFDVLA